MLNISTFSHSYHKNKECFRKEPEFYYRKGGDKVIVYIPKDTAHKVPQPEDIRTKVQNFSHKLQVNEIKELPQRMRATVKLSLHLPNKSPNRR